MKKFFVVVAGNIGVGKSTLVRMLSNHFGWQPFFEAVAENPYLADFYRDMRTWSFHSQIYFLTNRLRTHRRLLDHPNSVLQDRSVYEDAEVFAYNLYRQGFMRDRDYQTYRDLYEILTMFLPPPDLVVYLRASVLTLQERIADRGRDFEKEITEQYLSQINELYETWIQDFTLCPTLTVPADDLDYVKHLPHFELIAHKVREKLSGKEEVVFNSD